jgi:nucleoside 2-deoxyribosyltransferase
LIQDDHGAAKPDGHDRPRVYLAGPEVFLRDAVEQGEKKKALCGKYGLEGVFPFDTKVSLDDYPSRRETGYRISEANEALIRGCVAMIANMTPFRGVSTDVGTAYEMGFGRALGLVVFAYTNIPVGFVERTARALGPSAKRDERGHLRDAQGMTVEEWDLTDNLMLEGGIRASGGELVLVSAPEDALFTYLDGFEKCARLASKALLR